MPLRTTRGARASGPRHERAVAAALAGVRALVDGLQESARAIEQESGISNAQLFLLRVLVAEGPLSLGALAGRGRTQQSTVSLVVRRLEDAGHVARERDPADARRVVLRATPRGRRLVVRAPPAPTDRLLAALDGMAASELEQFAAGCGALCTAMGLDAAAAPMLFERGVAARGG